MAFVAQFLGRRLAYTYEGTELVAAERFVMRTAEGPFPMETTYLWLYVPLPARCHPGLQCISSISSVTPSVRGCPCSGSVSTNGTSAPPVLRAP